MFYKFFLYLRLGDKERVRTAFSSEQLIKLEETFNNCPYVTQDQRCQLSKELNIEDQTVKIWFQNRRMKAKSGKSAKFHWETTTLKTSAVFLWEPIHETSKSRATPTTHCSFTHVRTVPSSSGYGGPLDLRQKSSVKSMVFSFFVILLRFQLFTWSNNNRLMGGGA